MAYTSKKRKRTFKKMVRDNEGDGYRDPYRTVDDRLSKRNTILTRGGAMERSHKKTVGNRVNKNLDKKLIVNNVLDKYIKRIDDFHSSRRKNAMTVKEMIRKKNRKRI